jgi:diaminopropionate ammonia-lyase
MIPQVLPTRYFLNPRADRGLSYGPLERAVYTGADGDAAFREISCWSDYAPTPLRPLPWLAGRLGIRGLLYKDEGSRLGLGSFKALGGAYGVFQVLRHRILAAGWGPVTSADLLSGRHREIVGGVTVVCASLGNHGRSVAWGAAMFGCRATVFLPADTASDRVSAIEALGARIVPVPGDYDDAVALAAERAREEGWDVVSDTAWPGYEEVPRSIMHGYTVMVREALDQLPGGELPTHVFVQAGVGGLAAAVTAFLWERLGTRRPLVAVVEPAAADCLFESALRGGISATPGTLDTAMSCLACRYPSTLAWRILERGADVFLTLPDYGAEETTALLAQGSGGDPAIASQPSGVAGLAGLLAAAFEPTLSGPLDLGENSVVMVFGSEGPPFPEERP